MLQQITVISHDSKYTLRLLRRLAFGSLVDKNLEIYITFAILYKRLIKNRRENHTGYEL